MFYFNTEHGLAECVECVNTYLIIFTRATLASTGINCRRVSVCLSAVRHSTTANTHADKNYEVSVYTFRYCHKSVFY